eukprot:25486-Eustigmatos_ZCMA.PRE.1
MQHALHQPHNHHSDTLQYSCRHLIVGVKILTCGGTSSGRCENVQFTQHNRKHHSIDAHTRTYASGEQKRIATQQHRLVTGLRKQQDR